MLSRLTKASLSSQTRLFRRFSSDPRAPRGFEKFYRKQQSAQASPDPAKADSPPQEPKTASPDQDTAPKAEPQTSQEEPNPQQTEELKGRKSEEQKKTLEEPEIKEKPKEEPKDSTKKDYARFILKGPADFAGSFRSMRPGPFNPLQLLAVGAASLLALYTMWPRQKVQLAATITFQELVKRYVEPDLVKKIIVHMAPPSKQSPALIDVSVWGQENLLGRLKIPDVNSFLRALEFEQVQLNRDRTRLIPVEYEGPLPGSFSEKLETSLKFSSGLSSMAFFGLTIWWVYRLTKGQKGKGGGGFDIFNMNKANFKVYGTDIKIETRFKDVAGLKEAKVEIMEFVDFLKQPQRFKKLGAKIPKGALLVGPPGTGKTLLAKAAAGEAGVPFFAASGSDFVEMFVGLGASRVRQLFKQAKERAPSIIFIDEIDAVGRKRHGKTGGNEERDQTLNQLLVEMDGFGTETNVVVLAGTNRKDILDSALLRPGRFDRTIELTMPDIESRESILKLHLAPIKLDPDTKIEEFARRLAALTPGFSGADLANLCNEAAIMAARKDKSFVDKDDFENASERVIGGLEKTKKLSKEEREVVATHESGHAVASWFLEGADPLLKVSILPRSKGALGFAQFLPNETALHSKEELMDKICAVLAGRAAEEIFFGRVTTGAQDDLLKATQIAHAIVATLGMNERLGVVGYNLDTEAFNKPFSEDTNTIIDEEVRAIVIEGLARARSLLESKRELVDKLREKLLEKERLVQRDLVDVLGRRPFEMNAEHERYVTEGQSK